MPIPQFGATFQPGLEQNGNGISRTANLQQPRVQEAIKMLSLRLPRVYGAAAPAAPSLLTSPGGMGQPAARGNVVAQALAMMAGLPPGMTMPQASAPVLQGFSPTTDWMRQERDLMRPGVSAPVSAADRVAGALAGSLGGWQPGTPHVGFRQTTDGGSDEVGGGTGNWYSGIDERPQSGLPYNPPITYDPSRAFPTNPQPIEFKSYSFGEGPYGGSERLDDPLGWLSPFERQYGRYPDY